MIPQRLVYIANARMPTEKAHGYQIRNIQIYLKSIAHVQISGIKGIGSDFRIVTKLGTAAAQILEIRVAAIFRLAREVNPNIECKLNTVVCTYNWQEKTS